MKKLFLLIGLSLSLLASSQHTSTVKETLSSGGYTYMKVQDKDKSYWIAMTQRDVKVGDTISYSEQGWMKNFHSKTLNRTFENILFAADVAKKKTLREQIPKKSVMKSSYQDKNSIAIAELFANRDKYVGKIVTIKGKVTKTSKGIMKLNWLHLQDGSNFENMDDLVFTSTQELPANGEIIYAKGKVIKDKDFGYGYFYPVIIQEATFSK